MDKLARNRSREEGDTRILIKIPLLPSGICRNATERRKWIKMKARDGGCAKTVK
jgi:hypothetical protein